MNRPRAQRPRTGWAAAGLALALAAAPTPTPAQDVRSLPLTEIQQAAAHHVNARQFPEAIPYLEQLVYRLRDAEDEAAWKVLDYAMFHLALARLEDQSHQRAIDGFRAYLDRFPTGIYARGAHLLWAEAHAALEQWAEVITVMGRFLRDPALDRAQRAWGQQLVGEAWFRQQQWARAVDPLAYVFANAARRDARTQAAVMLTTSLVGLERFEDLFRIIPYLYQTTARFDIDLNLALLEAGDRNYEAERYLYAISLYRLVYFKPELEEHLAENLAAAERDRRRIWQEPGLDRSRMVALDRALQRRIQDYQAQQLRLREVPDYDQQTLIRLAQTYLNLQRHWEALTQFRRVFDEHPEHPLAEQALYSAFATAREMDLPDRAVREGNAYLEAFPLGPHWEPLTVDLAQLHIHRKAYGEALAVAEDALALKPDHTFRPHLLYLAGYCQFHREELEPSLARFQEILDRHADSAFVEDAAYWRALCLLFLQRYPEAGAGFADFLADFAASPYREDASFRLAVAHYGEGDFAGCLDLLTAFVAEYPGSALVGEAYCMLGDIRASWGRLDEALADYARATEAAESITEINYALFQSCRVYELEQRYDDIVRICRAYLDTHGEAGRPTQAAYWIGTAFLRSNRPAEAYQSFFDAIAAYGDQPDRTGIDMILRDLIAEPPDRRAGDLYRDFARRLYRELAEARTAGRATLQLRLTTLFAETQPEGDTRRQLHAQLLRTPSLEPAGPLTLLVIGREAAAAGQTDLSRAAYQGMLDRFGDSDFALDALWALAELEMAAAEYDAADARLARLLERFPTLPRAGDAQKRRGDIRRRQGRWTEAIEAYTVLLGVRDWRGPLFPEALYWIGECHLQLDNPREAFAFFQRIYVLYGAYPGWVAKGYLRSAECLDRLGERAQAVATLEEMLAQPALADLPEAATARQTLANWQGDAS